MNEPRASASELLREKLEYLRQEHALAYDAAKKFGLGKQIEELERELSRAWPEVPDEDLVAYLTRARERLLDQRAPGFAGHRLRDFATDLFVAPRWAAEPGGEQGDDLVAYLVAQAARPVSALILGGAGQGKSTLLRRLFWLLVDRYAAGDPVVPFFVPLRSLAERTVQSGSLTALWRHLRSDFQDQCPLAHDQFRRLFAEARTVLLLDGLDEAGTGSQEAVNRILGSQVFQSQAILSCRQQFFDIYLEGTRHADRFEARVTLLPWPFQASQSLLSRVDAQRGPRAGEILAEWCAAAPALENLLERPLLLGMILDVTAGGPAAPAAPGLARLYQRYTDSWLGREAGKPGSVLTRADKADLLEEVAWALYTEQADRSSFTRLRLREIVEKSPRTDAAPGKVAADLLQRSLLTEDGSGACSFLHRSFQDFFVARSVARRIRLGPEQAAAALAPAIRFEVATFLREMLSPGYENPEVRETMSRHLAGVFERAAAGGPASIHLHHQAVFYLSTLRTDLGCQFLERRHEAEPDLLIRRSMKVALGLFWQQQEVLDGFLRELEEDPAAAEANTAYHLVYYGDQPVEDGQRARARRCDRTVAALLRHFQSRRPYEILWPLDLFTLRDLLARAEEPAALLSSVQQGQLERFLAEEGPRQGPLFREQVESLAADLRRRIGP